MYLAYSLHFVMNGLVLLFLFERASSPAEILGLAKKKNRETILAAIIDV